MNFLNRRFIYALLLLLVITGIVMLIAFKGPLAPVKVKTVKLSQSSLQPAVFGIGTVEALRSYHIGPTRTGRLLKLFVDHGDRVKRGQLLGKMDPVDLPDRLQSAQLSIKKTEHVIEAAQARLDEAVNRAAQANRDASRYRDLVAKKQVSKESADAKETDSLTANDQVHAAMAELKGDRQDLQILRSDLKALQAQIDELNLTSPVDGLVIAREVEPGSVITAGVTVLQLIDRRSLWVRTRIEQRNSSRLKIGLPAEIQLQSQPRTALAATVSRLELIADSLTEERWVDVAFKQIPENLAIGTLANVTIQLPIISQAKWLPAAAIQTYKRKTGVWLQKANKTRFTAVKTGTHTLDGKVQILAGLTATDNVIVYSAKPLTEGQRIKVVNHD